MLLRFLAVFIFLLFSFCKFPEKQPTQEEIRKREFSSIITYYSGKDGNGYDIPDNTSAIVSHFTKLQKLRILESFTDPRRNLYGWAFVQDEFGKESWIRNESIGAKLRENEGIGEIFTPSGPFEGGVVSDTARPGENLGLTLEFFLQKGEIHSFGPLDKKKFRQFSLGSKENLKYLSGSKNAVLDLKMARRLGGNDEEQGGCWFGYMYNAKSEHPVKEIHPKDIVYRGDVRPKLIEGELKFQVQDKAQINRILRIAEELRPYSKIEEIKRKDEVPWKCDDRHCHTAEWKLPNKTYLFATLESWPGSGFYSLFFILSIENGTEKVVMYHFDRGSETKALFFSRLTDIDGDGVPEIWLGDQDSHGESYYTKYFLFQKDLLLPLGRSYWTGC